MSKDRRQVNQVNLLEDSPVQIVSEKPKDSVGPELGNDTSREEVRAD